MLIPVDGMLGSYPIFGNIVNHLTLSNFEKYCELEVVGGLAAIRKLKNSLPQSKLLDVYRALVENHLRYANVVWGALPSTKLSTLQRYQNRAFNLMESSKLKDVYNRNVLDVRELIVTSIFPPNVLLCKSDVESIAKKTPR